MINLASDEEADKTILEELYLAEIPKFNSHSDGEVPYNYVGKIGNWEFRRAWTYWIVGVNKTEDGMKVKDALRLYNMKHPTDDSEIMGKFIRAGGDAGCSSPDGYTSQPVYGTELDEKLKALGYKEEIFKPSGVKYIPITFGELASLCNEGKLDVERYVDVYHIDTQIGLTVFADFLRNL